MNTNVIAISGRLTRDPEPRTLASGDRLAKFSVAVDNFGRDKGASFFDCACFGKNAEYVLSYVTKGQKVIVVGRHESNKGSDGKTYWTLTANSVETTEKGKDTPTPTTIDDTYDPFSQGEYA